MTIHPLSRFLTHSPSLIHICSPHLHPHPQIFRHGAHIEALRLISTFGMAPKRKSSASSSSYISKKQAKASSSGSASTSAGKAKQGGSSSNDNNNHKTSNGEHASFDHSRPEERAGIVDRRFYPAEMSNERCQEYKAGIIERPLDGLHKIMNETRKAREKIKPGHAVLHWFKRDLRYTDNRGLATAARRAGEAGLPLVALFVVSPQDYEAHVTSAVRVDFELRSLSVLQEDLEGKFDVPLTVVTVDKRREIPAFIVEFCKKWEIKDVFCNIEYEVDELRREAKLVQVCLDEDINFTPIHDDVVVQPGQLASGAGKQYAVYTPWYRSWLNHLHTHPELLEEASGPEKNPPAARETFSELFDTPIPKAPANKALTAADKKRFTQLWPAGEHAALERLQFFVSDKIKQYDDQRNVPSAKTTSMLSVHHAAGTLAARTSVRVARDANQAKSLGSGNKGIVSWISEVAWRDFYKHVLAHWPYVCMFKPFKIEHTDVEWEYDEQGLQAWCDGRTGYPLGKSPTVVLGYI